MTFEKKGLTTIGFDADDTLWQNERFFRLTEDRFRELIAGHAGDIDLSGRLLEIEKRNLGIYGFGIKGFVLSMIETAIEASDGRVPVSAIKDILSAGRDMLAHPIEPLPHAREALQALGTRYRLILITKGDLFDQERKVAQSGLAELFTAVEIVADKSRATYERIFARHGEGAERAMMVGNALRSDVLPAIEAGAWGVYVPHDLTWDYEHADAPLDHPRFRQIAHLGDLDALVSEIDAD